MHLLYEYCPYPHREAAAHNWHECKMKIAWQIIHKQIGQ